MVKGKTLKVYFCGTDLMDIELGATDIVAFPSLKSLKQKRKCLKECGIVVCELTLLKVLKKPAIQKSVEKEIKERLKK